VLRRRSRGALFSRCIASFGGTLPTCRIMVFSGNQGSAAGAISPPRFGRCLALSGSDEIDQVLIGENEDGYEAGDLAPLPGASASARVNDLFLLGSHFLICGDATDPAVVRRLMRTDVARMVLTDEPFNVAIGGHVTGGDHREFVVASGEMTDSQFLDFNQKWMDAVLPHLLDGGILGTFIDWRELPIVHTAATGLGLTPLNLVVWAKTNAGLGSLY